MSIEVAIVDGPLPIHSSSSPTNLVGECGAVLLFDGVVRGLEAGTPIAGLTYEVYEPMTSRELGLLATQALSIEGVRAVRVWHSRGFVPVGGASFRIEVRAAHRKEAIRATDEFVDRMKRDVPIWKRSVPLGREASAADR